MDASYDLARYLVNTKYEDIPAAAVEAAKKEVLDQLGVGLGGSAKPGVRELLEINKEWGGKPESTVFCFGDRLPAPMAAQVNATMGHALDYDDTGDGPTHPSVVIVPTAFAMAERKGNVTGEELLASIATGVDVMCRLGGLAPGSQESQSRRTSRRRLAPDAPLRLLWCGGRGGSPARAGRDENGERPRHRLSPGERQRTMRRRWRVDQAHGAGLRRGAALPRP